MKIVEYCTMIWILYGLITAFQILPKGNTKRNVFNDWTNSLMKLNGLDRNWLTSVNPQSDCMDVSDFVCGNCVYINHMENDPKLEKQFLDSSAFHILCYTVVRRSLEIMSLYLARWMPLSCVVMFLLSCGSFIAMSCLNKEWKKKEKIYLSKRFITTLVGFALSSLGVLSVILPIFSDYIFGGVLNKEMESFQEVNDEYLFKKVLRREKVNACSTLKDLYEFRCLRKTIFDLEASGPKELLPEPYTLNEKICCQIQIVVINGITILASCILYFIPALVLFVTVRFCKGKLKPHLQKLNISKTLQKSSSWKCIRLLSEGDVSEKCNKKTVEPGMKKPWQELSFSRGKEKPPIHSDAPLKWIRYSPPLKISSKSMILRPMKVAKKNDSMEKRFVRSPIENIETEKIGKITNYFLSPAKEANRNCKIEKVSVQRPSENTEPVKIRDDTNAIPHQIKGVRGNYMVEKLFVHPRSNENIQTEKIAFKTESKEKLNDRKISYVDAGTYVCFDDSEEDSDASD